MPHQFGFDEKSKSVKLCLQRRDWDSEQLIADTYMPWAMEWLVFFEPWLATGEWLGDGQQGLISHDGIQDQHTRLPKTI